MKNGEYKKIEGVDWLKITSKSMVEIALDEKKRKFRERMEIYAGGLIVLIVFFSICLLFLGAFN